MIARRLLPLAAAACLASGCAGPRGGDELRVSVPWDVDTLDPHARDLAGGFQIAGHLFDTLVRRDAEMHLQPGLALRWINPDPSTWVFTLRPGVRFQDGRPLEAADVVASLERVRAGPRLQVGSYALGIERVRAIDASTVEIRTRRPVAVLLNRLALVAIVPRDAAASDLAARPVGSGPYRLVAWTRGASLELERHEAWWGGTGGPRRVVLRLARLGRAALDDVRDGASDVAVLDADAAREPMPSGVRRLERPGLAVRFLGTDAASETSPEISAAPNPLRRAEVRRALSMAIDRRRLEGVVATQLVAPPVFGFDRAVPPPRVDAAAARAALAAAGLPEGFTAVLHARRLVASAAVPLREMLAAIGVRLDVRVEDEATFFRTVEGRPALFLSRYACDTGDASDVLVAGLHTPDPARRMGTANAGRYADAELDALVEAAGEEMDPVKRARRLAVALRHAGEQMPWIPLDMEPLRYAVRDGWSWQPRADGWVLGAEFAAAR